MKNQSLKEIKILIMAGGTGGHVFPALAVARQMNDMGMHISWLGTRNGIEARLIPQENYIDLHYLSVMGLRRQGLKRLLLSPFKIGMACIQAAKVLMTVKPNLVLGMGGFASGPGGLMAKLMCYPLVIHEQNAVPGLTNRILSTFATRVLQAFPGTFKVSPGNKKFCVTGNPVRQEITVLPEPAQRYEQRSDSQGVNILILGGSQGATVLNETVPLSLVEAYKQAQMRGLQLNIWHQAGRDKDEQTSEAYQRCLVPARVMPFVVDMDKAYAWADLVIARSGALTVSEIQQAGVAAIFVPYPAATDDHQTKNAQFLAQEGAAIIVNQEKLSVKNLTEIIVDLLDKTKLRAMAIAAKNNAPYNATNAVVNACMDVINV